MLNLEGKLVTQALIQTDVTADRDFLRGISGSVHLTFEEGTHAQWLYDLTLPLVSELVVCNARQAGSKGNKSDRLDALKLAQLLRAGMLKEVYHGSSQAQTLKHLSHNYNSITSNATRCMNRLKSLYSSRAVACSGMDVYYTRNRQQWLDKLTEEGLSLRAEFLYKQLDHLRSPRRDAKKALVKEAQRHAAFKRLCDVHGLGPVRVAQIIAAVGAPHRFRTKRQFWTCCGLSAVTRSSSDYEIVGSELQRRPKSTKTRGLNREFNHRLKKVFKSAAIEALKERSIKGIYTRLTAKWVRSEMALLTVARKLAAVSLAI